MAIPPAVSAFIEWSPLLPTRRAQLLQRAPQGSLVKAEAIYDRPFWRDDKLSGQMHQPTRGWPAARSTTLRRPGRPACSSASSAAPRRAAGTTFLASARRDTFLKQTGAVLRPASAEAQGLRGEELVGRGMDARLPGCVHAAGSAVGLRHGHPRAGRAGSTGQAPKPPPIGTATWTARSAPVSARPPRS